MNPRRLTGTGRFWSGVDGGREARVVRQGRLAAHPEDLLHPALGRQPVVVPGHRVEHAAAAHPLVAGDQVGVRVRQHVAHVQGAAHRQRRRVDGEYLDPGAGAVEGVGAGGLPPRRPPVLETVQGRSLRHRVHGSR